MKNKARAKLGAYSMSGRRMIPAAKVWPNGEFSLGYAWEGEKVELKEELVLPAEAYGTTDEELDERLAAMLELLDEVERAYSVSGRLAWRLLTLSSARNSRREAEPIKYGLHGITGQGTKMLRSAAFIMERDYGCSDVTMGTFTVPHLERNERVLLAQQWGSLTNRLVEYLRRELQAQGRPPIVAGCTEIQSARLESRSEGYLHLHVIWPAHSNMGRLWAIEAGEVRTWWKRAIERIIGRELAVAPRVETAIVQKSVEAYLGKYLSKGSDDCLGQFVADLGYESVPGQWWFMSSYLKRKIKAETLTGRTLGSVLEAYIEHTVTSGTGAGFEWLRHVDLNLDGRLLAVGYVGRLDRATRDDLAMLLRIDSGLDLCTVEVAC
jgi:hypothetical protein